MISSHETIDTIIEALTLLSDNDKDVYLANKIEMFPSVVVDFSGFVRLFRALTTDNQKEFFITALKSKLFEIIKHGSFLEAFVNILNLRLREFFFDAFKDYLPDFLIKSNFPCTLEFRDLMCLIKCPRQKNELFDVVKDKLIEEVKDFDDFKRVLNSFANPDHIKSFTLAIKDKVSFFSVKLYDLPLPFLVVFNFCGDMIIEFKPMLSALIKDTSDFIHVLSCLNESQKEIFFDLVQEKLTEIARDLSQRRISLISELLPESEKARFTRIIELLKSQNVEFKKEVAFESENIVRLFDVDEYEYEDENVSKDVSNVSEDEIEIEAQRQRVRASEESGKPYPLQQFSILKPRSIRFKGDDFVESPLEITADNQESKTDSGLSARRR